MRFTALALLPGLALVLFACSGEAPTGSTKGGTTAQNRNAGDDDADDKDTKAGSNTSTPTQTTNPTDPAPASGGQCASQAKAEACFDCCDPSKGAVFQAADQAWGDCICGAAGKCATQCAQTFCNQANPAEPQQGDACDTCLQQNADSCDQIAGDVCDKDASCTKASECIEAAKCYEKPE